MRTDPISVGHDGMAPRLPSRRRLEPGFYYFDEDSPLRECEAVGARMRLELRRLRNPRTPAAQARYRAAEQTERVMSAWWRGHGH